MQIETTISDITHEDLVNLFSCAIYGSNYLYISTPKEYREASYLAGQECEEDKWAEVLLHEGQLYGCDYSADDEEDILGDLPYMYDCKNGCMKYSFCLADVITGLQKAFASSWAREYVLHLMDEPEQLDLYEAEALMQFILFGEAIYG